MGDILSTVMESSKDLSYGVDGWYVENKKAGNVYLGEASLTGWRQKWILSHLMPMMSTDALRGLQEMDSPKQPRANGISGEPSILVRVGDQYQVAIPIMCVRWTKRQNKHGQQNFPDTHAVSSVSLPRLQPVEVEDYSPSPCSPANPWTDTEAQSFLLALHFFGKNFVEVRKFIENKEMGDILFYYYGEFYRSDIRRSWLVCRKGKSRKCIHGRGIVTGWRRNELLSRLAPMMSTDVLCGLQEAPKTFNDDKDASFVKYVHTLKAAVGIQALVEAVAIGKGERDLTGIAAQTVRKIQVTTHSEIPIVKECSSLTCPEIFEFLNGNTRLSKALSNDIFWGAVWPRLLARGWHLEQPGHLSFVGSKRAFIFLVPGVKEFSRKELEKRTHYFDSVCDVLNKVAADPRIIGLDDEGDKGGSDTNDDCGSDTDARLDQNGLPDHQGHCSLRPRLSDCSSEPTMFTSVDTSLVQGESAPIKIWRLRSSLRNNPPSCFSQIGSKHSEEHESSTDNQLQVPELVTSTKNSRSTVDEPTMPQDLRQLLVDSEAMETLNGVLCDEQTSISSRRQGTRNRPPTMKALEAIADGLLGTKRKGRGNDSQSRSSRLARRNVEPPSLAQNTDPATARESNARMDIGYAADEGSRMLGNSHIQSEGKRIH